LLERGLRGVLAVLAGMGIIGKSGHAGVDKETA